VVWAETTERSWPVVLDDLRDSADLRDLWPPESAVGQVMVTIRPWEAALTGLGQTVVEVGLWWEK
jgi:hypothetical protein